MSFGEPIALRGHAELEPVASGAAAESRSAADLRFIKRLQAGELAAFDRLVEERSGEVYSLLFRLTEDPEEARDLTQETFLRAFQSVGRFRGDSELRTWLFRIAINQARNRWRWWRRRCRDATASIDAAGTDGEPPLSQTLRAQGRGPEEEALAHERERVLRTALRALGRVYREVIVLRDVEGMSYEEVAATLEISIGTVKSRLSRGRNELRRRLEGSL